MELLLYDWLSLLLRWAHVMFSIAWIGTSFYFIWLDASLRKRDGQAAGVAGETWMVHGGGFYRVEKYLVAPQDLPATLHWFKYEAYFTWISGILLLAVIYYWGAESFLLPSGDAPVSATVAIIISAASFIAGWFAYDLMCRSALGAQTARLAVSLFVLILAAAWLYGFFFSGRAAFIHVGALIGTWMVGNVFFIIIPNQKRVVADLKAGKAPDPALGAQAKQRSLHNNYLTLPVVLMMISNHYPFLYSGSYGWLLVGAVVVIGGLIRHFFNNYDAGIKAWHVTASLPAAALCIVGLISIGYWAQHAPDEGETVAFANAQQIIISRCVSCHAANPTDEDFDAPPGDLLLDQATLMRRHAARILAQAVLSDAMPLGNKTEMTEEEREILGLWIRQGAPLE